MKGDTIYRRHPQGFHVIVAGRYRGFLPKHRPGYCIACEDKSNWPLCPRCHELVLDPLFGGAPLRKCGPVER